MPRYRIPSSAFNYLALAFAAVLFAGAVSAQEPVPQSGTRTTRAMLEARAAAAAQAADTARDAAIRAAKRGEAEAIRGRLRDGDFSAGDRIWISIRYDSVVADTFTVLNPRRLQLPDVPEIDLTGVLRSEVASHLNKQLSHYLKDPRVKATALIRVGVLGEVAHPGYFSFRSDALLSDAITQAGGPTQRADINLVSVRRGGAELAGPRATHEAIQQGMTLEQFGIKAGDEILLKPKVERNWTMIISTAAVTLGVIAGLLFR